METVQTTVRLSREMWTDLKIAAVQDGLSVQQVLEGFIKKYLEGRKS